MREDLLKYLSKIFYISDDGACTCYVCIVYKKKLSKYLNINNYSSYSSKHCSCKNLRCYYYYITYKNKPLAQYTKYLTRYGEYKSCK